MPLYYAILVVDDPPLSPISRLFYLVRVVENRQAMFIKKDLRKIEEILIDEDDERTSLKLSKRPAEFKGQISVLCRESKIQSLSNLRFLNLYENSLISLQGIGLLSETLLEEINLGCNKLSTIPLEFGSLKRLKTLWLDDNQLSELPICLCQLSVLTTLRLSGNDLSYLPPSISSLHLLEVLALDNNSLTSFPAGILELSNLKHLLLRQNRLTELPADLDRLSLLENFSVSSNQLESLPACLGSMLSLRKIYANGNKISSVPEDLCILPNIQEINLANNNLVSIPDGWMDVWGTLDGVGRLAHSPPLDQSPIVILLGNDFQSKPVITVMEVDPDSMPVK